jgi:hypothetical protein
MLEEGLVPAVHPAAMARQGAAEQQAILAINRKRLDALQGLNPLDQKGVQSPDGVRQGAAGLDPVRCVHQKGVR